MVNGAQLYISLGLGNFGIKTLFSYPLLKALKSTILLESGTLISGLLGEAFKLTIKKPDPIGEAPTICKGIPMALTSVPITTSTLDTMAANLTNEFRLLAHEAGEVWREDPAQESTRK